MRSSPATRWKRFRFSRGEILDRPLRRPPSENGAAENGAGHLIPIEIPMVAAFFIVPGTNFGTRGSMGAYRRCRGTPAPPGTSASGNGPAPLRELFLGGGTVPRGCGRADPIPANRPTPAFQNVRVLQRLRGDRAGQYSIRINDQYRIRFRWEDEYADDVEVTDYH